MSLWHLLLCNLSGELMTSSTAKYYAFSRPTLLLQNIFTCLNIATIGIISMSRIQMQAHVVKLSHLKSANFMWGYFHDLRYEHTSFLTGLLLLDWTVFSIMSHFTTKILECIQSLLQYLVEFALFPLHCSTGSSVINAVRPTMSKTIILWKTSNNVFDLNPITCTYNVQTKNYATFKFGGF